MVRASNRPVSVPPVQSSRLAASRLACRRGDRLLFRGLDFELAAGQIVWLRGPNGSSKTSLLRLLASLSTPAEGPSPGAARPCAGGRRLVPLALLPRPCQRAEGRSLGAGIAAVPRPPARPWRRRDRLHRALRRVGLFSRRHAAVRTLAGQRRSVALARLHWMRPRRWWILDEPTMRSMPRARPCSTPPVGARRRGGAAVLTSHIDLTLADPAPTVLQLDAYRVQ